MQKVTKTVTFCQNMLLFVADFTTICCLMSSILQLNVAYYTAEYRSVVPICDYKCESTIDYVVVVHRFPTVGTCCAHHGKHGYCCALYAFFVYFEFHNVLYTTAIYVVICQCGKIAISKQRVDAEFLSVIGFITSLNKPFCNQRFRFFIRDAVIDVRAFG